MYRSSLYNYPSDEWVVLVTDGSHAGVEPLGYEIVCDLERAPIPGVVTAEMHPEARQHGVRYLDKSEFGTHATADVIDATQQQAAQFDRDQLAVWRFACQTAEVPYWLGIDPHTLDRRNANAVVVGESSAMLQAVGAASVLGLDKIVMHAGSPYHNIFQRFIKIEASTEPGDDRMLQPSVWREALLHISDLGYKGLRALGRQSLNDVAFYLEVEICRLDAHGSPITDERVLKMIRLLEEIPDPGAYFAPIELPVRFKGQQQMLRGSQLCVGYWNDENNSPIIPALGLRHDGKPRRAYFGSLMAPIPPGAIHFDDDV